jgi:uncharacterized protein involved in exopolysaccharide biosynthesis
VVTVVEKPVPPMRKSSPNRVLIFLFSFVFGLAVGSGVALLSSFLVSGEKTEGEERVDKMREELKGGWV